MTDATGNSASEWDFGKIADLTDTEKTRLITTLLCHKAGIAPKQIDCETARAALGAASIASYRGSLNASLKKLEKGGNGGGKQTTPKKKAAKPAQQKKRVSTAADNEDDDDEDADSPKKKKSKSPIEIKPEPKEEEYGDDDEEYEYYG
ncbi:hypothetical protein K490DRAFT_59873 [Saccharata proteae CBS 121410]|uniref:Uncharacterized protein n=1 Tax=Saccharata proteae CBS 121410 TaxID=1314787 RepID=A0A9P4HPN7_9PEZI|nr:hypothetical protein K490DRAFT_59873 [Saccharata proteae CBS 121410]